MSNQLPTLASMHTPTSSLFLAAKHAVTPQRPADTTGAGTVGQEASVYGVPVQEGML